MAAIDELRAVLIPPDNPIGTGSAEEWDRLERSSKNWAEPLRGAPLHAIPPGYTFAGSRRAKFSKKTKRATRKIGAPTM